jgi:photosystem II stability/assembly factor-like uncharacterized protein
LRLNLVMASLLFSIPRLLPADDHHWERIGPPGGMVLTMESSSTGETVYLGTPDGHVFASTDGARHWELRGRVGSRTDTVISRLLADPSSPNVVYAAVWYQQPGLGGGVFRSSDSARTWKPIGLEQEAVRALEVASAQPLVLIAGARSGIFRSSDADQAWQRISPLGDEELRNVDSLAIDPEDPKVIYAGTYHLPWKTIDAGKNWNPVTAGLIDDSDIMSLRVDAANPERLFLSACSGIYRSENKGAQWTKLQGIPYAARRTHSILQDPQNPGTLYAATTEGLWVTRDSGESWTRNTTKDWVVNSVLVLRSGHAGFGRVVLGTEAQGVVVSEDGGENFASSNEGFTHQVVKQFIPDPRDSKHLLMVLQQNRPQVMESRDAGHTWIPLSLSAKQEVGKLFQLSTDSVDRFYANNWAWLARLQNGQLWLLEEQTGTWREWKLRLPYSSASLSRASNSSAVPGKSRAPEKILATGNVLGFSGSYVFVPSQKGLLRCELEGNCVLLRAIGRFSKLSGLHISTDGSVLTLVADDKLAVSRDAGQSVAWRDLPVVATSVLWVDNEPGSSRNSLFLGTSEGLFTSVDEGLNWTRRERGLPSGQIENWLWEPQCLIATLREGGMYRSADEGMSWLRIDSDSERSRIVGLVETEPGVIAVGSQSEGVLLWHRP